MDLYGGRIMRKVFLASVLSLLAFALMTGTAAATHSNGQGPDKDFIAGAAKGPVPTPFGALPAHFHTNAQSFASGGFPAQGTFFTDIDGGALGTVSFSGVVVCINAVGHGANWRGVITDANQPAFTPIGFGVLARWVDNGEGQNDPEDQQVGFLTPPPGATPTCPAIPFSTAPIDSGNLVVHDGI
jgi:hypothetical protein